MPAVLARFLLSVRFSRMLALVAAALVWLTLMLSMPSTWQLMDEWGTDWIWRKGATTDVERRIVVVDIDEASISRIGPWPWPRDVMAKLSEKIDKQGVNLKLYDVVFPENGSGVVTSQEQALATALQAAGGGAAPSILAEIFSLNGESTIQSGSLVGAIPNLACQPPMPQAQGYVGNQPGLATRAGHITPRIDPDGAVRRIPAFVCWNGKVFPALALAGLMAQAPGQLQLVPGQSVLDPAWRIRFGGLPGLVAPADSGGDIRVPYRIDRTAFVSVPAVDLLQDRAPKELMTGAWVIVGASAFGIGDAVPTPLGGAVSGVEVHAQLLAGLLDQTIPYTPAISWLAQAIAVLVGVVLLLVLLDEAPLQARQRAVVLPLVAAALALTVFALHALALVQMNIWIRWVPAALALLVSGVILAIAEHARAVLQKSRLFENLSSYLSPSVAEQIALNAPNGQIEACRRDVTILVADLRNFSRYCEDRPPEEAGAVLHNFFTLATEVLERHGGVVEDMIGDSVLAVFNGSRPCEHHSVQALQAARELWRDVAPVLPQEGSAGLEPLALGIGLETGLALVGSFGPSHRRVHTALGQTVTTALALQSMTADLAYPILIGQEAAARISASHRPGLARLKTLGQFLLPGLRQGCEVFTLHKPFFSPGVQVWENAQGDYSNVLYLQTRNI